MCIYIYICIFVCVYLYTYIFKTYTHTHYVTLHFTTSCKIACTYTQAYTYTWTYTLIYVYTLYNQNIPVQLGTDTQIHTIYEWITYLYSYSIYWYLSSARTGMHYTSKKCTFTYKYHQRKFGSPKFRVTDVYISSQCQLKQRIAKAQGS